MDKFVMTNFCLLCCIRAKNVEAFKKLLNSVHFWILCGHNYQSGEAATGKLLLLCRLPQLNENFFLVGLYRVLHSSA